MNRFINLCIIMVLLCACSNKQGNKESIEETQENDIAIVVEQKPETLYVNAKEGLRVRNEPNLTGDRIYLLSHKEPVVVVEKSIDYAVIDGIINYWYLIQNEKTYGWVFGGYLTKSLVEIEIEELKETIPGRYNFYSIDIKKDEHTYKEKKFDEFFCEIVRIDNNNFTLKYYSPESSNQYTGQFTLPPENKNIWYPSFISRYNGTPFYYMEGEIGGGGTYIYFYYSENKIIMDYKSYSNMNGYLEEGEPEMPISWLEFNMVFSKE